MKLPVYSRADLSRTAVPVVALSLAATSTSAVAREFRAADTQNEDCPTVRALRDVGRMTTEHSGGRRQIRGLHSPQLGEEREAIEQTRAGAMIVADPDRKPFEAAMAGIHRKAQRDPAAAAPIERIRKVE
jgi:TRAP-type C4-dicarboxylate transport system substrate-binding protein